MLTVIALKNKLAPQWNNLDKWDITSLEKGFYGFSFSFHDDVKRVRASPSWNLAPDTLKLFPWTKHFNLNLQTVSTAQTWIRLFGLAREYLRGNILFIIPSSIGTPIYTDVLASKTRFDCPYAHFVRSLVDMDLSAKSRHNVSVDRKGFSFFVDTEYESLP